MTSSSQQQLKHLLGRGFSIAACVGGTIGLEILQTPGEIAAGPDIQTGPGIHEILN